MALEIHWLRLMQLPFTAVLAGRASGHIHSLLRITCRPSVRSPDNAGPGGGPFYFRSLQFRGLGWVRDIEAWRQHIDESHASFFIFLHMIVPLLFCLSLTSSAFCLHQLSPTSTWIIQRRFVVNLARPSSVSVNKLYRLSNNFLESDCQEYSPLTKRNAAIISRL